MTPRRVFLGLGSNLGDRRGHLSVAVDGLVPHGLEAVSDLYETEPVGGPDQDAFLNLVVELHTALTPSELLGLAQQLELAAERRREVRWGPRTLDVDVLWVDGEAVRTPDLTVPHPRMWQRRFVLAPLAQLAPDLVDAVAVAGATGAVTRLGPLDET